MILVDILNSSLLLFLINTKDGWTAINIAALYSKTEVVKLLLDAGADMNKADKVCLMFNFLIK